MGVTPAFTVSPAPGAATSWSPADLTALCAHINALGLRCVTISQLWDYIQAGYVWPE